MFFPPSPPRGSQRSALAASARRARLTKACTRSGSFLPGADSTPLAVSTAVAPVASIAAATLSAVRPPAKTTGIPASPAATNRSQSTTRPVPPRLAGAAPGAAPASTRSIAGACPAANAAVIQPRASSSAAVAGPSLRNRQARITGIGATSRQTPGGSQQGFGTPATGGERCPWNWMASRPTLLAIPRTAEESMPAKTPMRRIPAGRAAATSRADSTVRQRGEPGTKLSPTASAPAAATIRASSGVVTPQIFTRNMVTVFGLGIGDSGTCRRSDAGRPDAAAHPYHPPNRQDRQGRCDLDDRKSLRRGAMVEEAAPAGRNKGGAGCRRTTA